MKKRNDAKTLVFWTIVLLVCVWIMSARKAHAFEADNTIRPKEQSIAHEPTVPIDRRVLKSGQKNHDEAVLISLAREEKKIVALDSIKPRKKMILPANVNQEPVSETVYEYSDPLAEKIDYSKVPSGLASAVDKRLRLRNER